MLPNTEWKNQDYEGRILTATQVILAFPEAAKHLAEYVHILVDEVQDLVGARAELVKAILEKSATTPGGWTLFGDPAQGIYNFQLEGEARKIGSAALYQWLRMRFRHDMREQTLTINHRAQSKALKSILPFGAALNAVEPDYQHISLQLRNVLPGLQDFGNLKSDSTLKPLHEPIPTAILCRNNGQALFISRHLYEKGVPHTYQRRATDRVLPDWIGILFNDYEGSVVDRENFQSLAEERLHNIDVQQYFDLLRQMGLAKGKNALDVGLLASRIREGAPLDDLCEQPRHSLVVSTIHRAKGLEFERVLLVRDEDRAENVGDLEEETRVLYVALTRPRRWLYRLAMPSHRGFLCKQNDSERWARKLTKWMVNDYEVLGDDAHGLDPAGGFLLNCSVSELQEYIRRHVKPRDPLVLKRLDAIQSGCAPRVHYAILHQNRPVGVTAERFGAQLFKMLKMSKNWKVRWPDQIDRLYVEAVDTVAGSALTGERLGLGNCGFWLRVRVAGLGRLRFTTPEK